MKNYYEILEINEKASQEVIEKVYKVLVKKYHPDLQENSGEKAKYEEKIKEINEAYEVLSDEAKRKEYDTELELEKQKQEHYSWTNNTSNNVQNNNINNNSAPNSQYSNMDYNSVNRQTNSNSYNNQFEQEQQKAQEQFEKQFQQDYQNAVNKAYHDAYVQDLKNRGYRIKYKKTKKDYLRSLIALLITIGILALIFQLPFVKNYFTDLYNNNSAFKGFIDFLGNIFK